MKISIVIPIYNCAAAVQACLRSLETQLPPEAEVLVVDNGSADGASGRIRCDHPGVRVIRNDKNQGASRARNQAIVASRGEWIISLDCDVTLRKTFMKEILAEMERAEPRVGLIQAKILKNDSGIIYSTGISLTMVRRFFDRGQGHLDKGQFDKKKGIFGPCSAAAAYRRSMLEEIKDEFGYFDERFFFLVEDVDLAWRARRAGWRAVFCPQAVCAHPGDSSKTNRFLRQYYCFRNRLWMLKKNEGSLGWLRYFLLSPFYDLPRWFYLVLTNPFILKRKRGEQACE